MRGSRNRLFQNRTDIAAFGPLAKVNCNGIGIVRIDVQSSAQNLLPSRRSTRFDLVFDAWGMLPGYGEMELQSTISKRQINRCRDICVASYDCSVKKTCLACVVCREKMHKCRPDDGPQIYDGRSAGTHPRPSHPSLTPSPLTHPLTPRCPLALINQINSEPPSH